MSAVQTAGIKSTSGTSQVPLHLRKLRDMQYQEGLFALLSKQFETTRFDKAKSAAVLQVVDQAVPVDRKAGPAHTLMVLSARLRPVFFAVSSLLCRDSHRAFARNFGQLDTIRG